MLGAVPRSWTSEHAGRLLRRTGGGAWQLVPSISPSLGRATYTHKRKAGVGGFMRRVLLRVVLTLCLACVVVLATIPHWVSAVGIPRELKVFPGMELSLDLESFAGHQR